MAMASEMFRPNLPVSFAPPKRRRSTSMVSSAAVVHRTSSPAQASMVAPFTGLKSASAFSVSGKATGEGAYGDGTSLGSQEATCPSPCFSRSLRNALRLELIAGDYSRRGANDLQVFLWRPKGQRKTSGGESENPKSE